MDFGVLASSLHLLEISQPGHCPEVDCVHEQALHRDLLAADGLFGPGVQVLRMKAVEDLALLVDGILDEIGPHKIGKSCLYLKKLEDAHLPTLKKLITKAYKSPAIPGAEID